MTGGQQQRMDRRPAPAAHRVARTLHRAVWIGCGISVLLTPASVWAQAKSNKNVRTWSWADEVVQPGSNVISRQTRTNGAMREITRQLLREARRAAERGQFDAAEKLALRAEALLKAATAAGQDAWDPADQTPSSFLRQLAAARLRQLPLMPRKEPAPAADELAGTALEAPPPPVLHDPLDPPAESAPQRGHLGRSRPHDGHAFSNQTALDWSPNPALAAPALREQPGAFDAADNADDFDNWESPPAAQVARTNPTADGRRESPKERPAKPAADQAAAAASPAAPAPTVVTERIIHIRDENEPPQRSLFASALAQILSTATGLVLGILVLVAARAFIRHRYNADFGFVFRVEHVATGEDGAYFPFPYFPGMQSGESLPMPTAGPGRNGAAAVLNELPSGFKSDDVSPYEEELRQREEAENEMMKMVLEQNLQLRENLSGIKSVAA